MIELTNEQNDIAGAIIDYALGNYDSVPYIAVSGYAGTGKTTVMGAASSQILRLHPNYRIAYCAPTGKAASVLKQKLKDFNGYGPKCTVDTVHGLIYVPVDLNSKKLVFVKKDMLDCDLIIVDEASMVTTEMKNDILSFNIPTIFIGDSGQLPPVGDTIFEPLVRTDLRLNTVHRQALENPIIYVATKVREGEEVPDGAIGKDFIKASRSSSTRKKLIDMFVNKIKDPETMILCGKNITRARLNLSIRDSLGIRTALPQKGEKLVCMRNAKDLGIFNGQTRFATSDAEEIPETNCFKAKIEGFPCKFTFYAGSLNTAPQDIFLKMDEDRDLLRSVELHHLQKSPLVFDFGYACSVHKAQGSEWNNVLLFDELMGNQSKEDHIRWLYTGITRAREKLCILH